ncbi:MAG: hypothetical protein U5K84_04015 [Alkalibacterium sp.]|nr:hypothetical protein [Alkalibacterium sp.]
MMAAEARRGQKSPIPFIKADWGSITKWNMWAMDEDPSSLSENGIRLYRKNSFNLITFSFMYTFNENDVTLPFSHDEVLVHGKKFHVPHKMFGDRYNQFAGLRTIQTYRMHASGARAPVHGRLRPVSGVAISGRARLDSLDDPMNGETPGIPQINQTEFYKEHRALWEVDHRPDGFEIL